MSSILVPEKEVERLAQLRSLASKIVLPKEELINARISEYVGWRSYFSLMGVPEDSPLVEMIYRDVNSVGFVEAITNSTVNEVAYMIEQDMTLTRGRRIGKGKDRREDGAASPPAGVPASVHVAERGEDTPS